MWIYSVFLQRSCCRLAQPWHSLDCPGLHPASLPELPVLAAAEAPGSLSAGIIWIYHLIRTLNPEIKPVSLVFSLRRLVIEPRAELWSPRGPACLFQEAGVPARWTRGAGPLRRCPAPPWPPGVLSEEQPREEEAAETPALLYQFAISGLCSPPRT